MARRSGLGRGLSALIPTEALRDRGALVELAVSVVQPEPAPASRPFRRGRPRRADGFGARDRDPAADPGPPARRKRVRADRRRKALAGGPTSRPGHHPGHHPHASEGESLQQALIENLNREELNPLEEAAGYQQLIEDFGLTHEQLSTRVGKSRVAITNALRLFQLPPSVQRLVAEDRLTAGHARALLGTPDRAFQEAFARRAANEQLSVRAVEEAVRQHNQLSEPEETSRPRPAPTQAAAAGHPRARGTARRSPQHQGPGRHGSQPGQGHHRVRHPRGPRAHLQGDDRARLEAVACSCLAPGCRPWSASDLVPRGWPHLDLIHSCEKCCGLRPARTLGAALRQVPVELLEKLRLTLCPHQTQLGTPP